MSRASKVFLGSSLFLSIGTIWGVHFLQKRESDTMYQGVLKDEARLKERAAELLRLSTPDLSSLPNLSNLSPNHITPNSSLPPSTPSTSSAPLNTPSSPVRQPSPVVDPECVTCVVSPPPELVEKQSREERARERQERWAEYEQQKHLGNKLEREQGVSDRV